MKELKMFIDGKFVENESGKWIQVVNPSTEEGLPAQASYSFVGRHRRLRDREFLRQHDFRGDADGFRPDIQGGQNRKGHLQRQGGTPHH